MAGDDDDTFGAIGNASWDQFAVNAKLFGVTGGFNEDDYTTKIDRNAADFKERELKAQRLAAEILGVCVLFLYPPPCSNRRSGVTDVDVKFLFLFVRLLLVILTSKRNVASMTVVPMKRTSKLFSQ